MSENSTAHFKTTNLEIDFDIGGVRYRAELIIDKVEKDNVNIPETEDLRQNDEMDDMQHNVQGNENENPDQSMRHTIKFCAGPKSVSLSRVLSPEGELEFRKTGEGVEDDDITKFAENWIMRVAPLFITEQGMIELNLDFLGLMQFLELVSYFAPIQEPFQTSEYDVGDENPFQPEDPTSTSEDLSSEDEFLESVKANEDEYLESVKASEDAIDDENKVIETDEDASSSSEDSTSGSEDPTPAHKDPTSRSEDPNNQ